jgi:hypothetical protein
MAEYYQLNFQRKPEHLQWWLPREEPRPSPLTTGERTARLDAFGRLVDAVDQVRPAIHDDDADAFFQLVLYPVVGSALANRRYFLGEEAAMLSATDAVAAERLHAGAVEASVELVELTRRFNEDIAKGKWNGFMNLEPADGQWSSMRVAPWEPLRPSPEVASRAASEAAEDMRRPIVIEAESFSKSHPGRDDREWRVIPGLGRSGDSIAVFPMDASSVEIDTAPDVAPSVEYRFIVERAGAHELIVHLLPTHPLSGDSLRLGMAVDDGAPELLDFAVGDGARAWAEGVLAGVRKARTNLDLKVAQPGPHVLRVYGIDAGVVIDRFIVTRRVPNLAQPAPRQERLQPRSGRPEPWTNRG